ncbi:MAG: mechanosensitive ion channel family protein [Oscillospiraceae bacterium]|nr:mechanosensitive ion channel family protein [Oscillospiraceae bacterium]
MGAGTQFDKTELQRLMQEQGVDPKPEEVSGPEPVRKKIVRVVMLLVMIAYFVVLLFGKYFLPEDNEILLSMNVFSQEEAPNHLVYVASLAILTLSASTILRFFIARMAENSALTKRTGRAVIELLGNFVKYIAVLVLVLLFLNALGVDTAGLLAGLGILGLVLGLGVTSLVEDVVAGIFIIGERLFDVGDIVVVDDFRGRILSIGIRSTQIEDDGGDIMIMRNSTIENLVNMTNRSSYAICDVPINPTESFAHVEEVINNAHLEKLKERYPEIEKGPFYLGLSEINGKGVQIITFVAICQEDTKYWIQRIMNRELKLLFEKNGIKLGEEPGDDDDD